jgi:hypothetical protein
VSRRPRAVAKSASSASAVGRRLRGSVDIKIRRRVVRP